MNRISSIALLFCYIMSMSAMKRKSESPAEPPRVNCTTVNFFDADTHEPIDPWQLSDDQLKQLSTLSHPDLVENQNLRRELMHKFPTFSPQQTINATQRPLKLTFDAKGTLATGSFESDISLFKPDDEGKYHHQQTFGQTTTLLACDSKTGRLAASAPPSSLSGNPAWCINVWSPDDSGTHSRLQTIPLYANSASFNQTTGTLAVGSYSNNIKLFNPTAQGEYQLAQTIDTSPMVFNDPLIFHPTTGILAAMRLNDMMIKLYKPQDDGSYQFLQTLTLPYQVVFTNIAWHPTEALLGSQITLGAQIVLWILNTTSGNYEHWQTIGRIPKPVHNLSFAFDTTGDTLVASCGKVIEIWSRDTKTRKYQLRETISMPDDITTLAFNPINDVLAVGSESHNITLLAPNYVGLRNATFAQLLLLTIAQQKKSPTTSLDPSEYPALAPIMASFQEEPHKSNVALQNLVKLLIHQGAHS